MMLYTRKRARAPLTAAIPEAPERGAAAVLTMRAHNAPATPAMGIFGHAWRYSSLSSGRHSLQQLDKMLSTRVNSVTITIVTIDIAIVIDQHHHHRNHHHGHM